MYVFILKIDILLKKKKKTIGVKYTRGRRRCFPPASCHCVGHCRSLAAIGLRWTRACLARWSDRENRLPHASQPYGLTPECERQCRDSSSDRENRHVQPGHMQPYGFSPECRRMCTCANASLPPRRRRCQISGWAPPFRFRGGTRPPFRGRPYGMATRIWATMGFTVAEIKTLGTFVTLSFRTG